MNRLFGALLVAVSAIVLSACGTATVPNAEMVTLEVQVVSSESDSTPVEYVEVRNSADVVVASVRDSINRFVAFELPRGDYSVVSKVSGYKGSVEMARSVTLSGNTNVLLDLTDETFYGYYEDYLDTGVRKSSFLMVTEGQSRVDESVSLYLESIYLNSHYLLSYESVEARGLSVFHTLVHEAGSDRWSFTPKEDRIINSVTITIDIDFVVQNCVTYLGAYEIHWYGEGVSKQQTLINTPLCTKG